MKVKSPPALVSIYHCNECGRMSFTKRFNHYAASGERCQGLETEIIYSRDGLSARDIQVAHARRQCATVRTWSNESISFTLAHIGVSTETLPADAVKILDAYLTRM